MTAECSNCRFWKRIPDDELHNTDLPDEGLGHCMRYPPTVVSCLLDDVQKAPIHKGKERFGYVTNGMIRVATVFPVTYDCDTCGEHKQ